jgi:aminoglycoside phosphotransferase (APT) family kinase protein
VDVNSIVRPTQLGELLADALSDDRWRQLEVDLISGGKSNLTFGISSAAGELILRRPPTGILLPRAHDMGREVRIQQALKGTGVPVPAIVLTQSEPGLLDVPFYVMERVEGIVIRDDLPPEIAADPAAITSIADSLIDTLAEIHRVDPRAVGLDDFGRPGGFAERQVRTWHRQYEAASTRTVPAVDELHRVLSGYTWPDTARAAVVHGDYRLDNCLVTVDAPRVVGAVLDWEMSTIGDPLCDLGLLLSYWVQAGEPAPLLTPAVTQKAGFPTRADIEQRYARNTGVDLSDVNAYVALAHFKFVGIAQGISARVKAGQMAGQDFGDLDAEIERIAEAGLTAWKGHR